MDDSKREEITAEVVAFVDLWDTLEEPDVDTVLTCFFESAWPTRRTQDN